MSDLSYTLTELLASTGLLLGIVVGLTEITKRVLRRFLNEDFVSDLAPLFSIFWGVFYSYLAYLGGFLNSFVWVVYTGTIIGLSASGLWDVGKRSVYKGFVKRLKE